MPIPTWNYAWYLHYLGCHVKVHGIYIATSMILQCQSYTILFIMSHRCHKWFLSLHIKVYVMLHGIQYPPRKFMLPIMSSCEATLCFHLGLHLSAYFVCYSINFTFCIVSFKWEMLYALALCYCCILSSRIPLNFFGHLCTCI